MTYINLKIVLFFLGVPLANARVGLLRTTRALRCYAALRTA
ncbi:MAG: hypothetical protein NZ455_14085 [Bacteroidia bacterium]|nr:hypothetical protein [Bacteroidia bacterium]MDW8348457.1 hypothetical protein [Bacteroidia bacterium]